MIIVPGSPQVEETRHSRELGRRIEHVVREYQRDNPDVSLSDVRIALMQRTPGGEFAPANRRKSALAVGIGALSVGVFTALASNGGRFAASSLTWQIIGVVAALCAVAFAVIRTVRRS